MPPKITVTREQVRQAGLELLRREGAAALTARRLAQELGCSTQPVYRAYGSMEELREAVLELAGQVVMRYLSPEAGEDPPFLALGLGSLRLARDEPHLYQAVSRSGPALRDLQQGKPPPDFVLQRMKAEPMLEGLSDEQLTRINALMWFFSQGLATLFFADLQSDPMEAAEEYLLLAGRAVIEFEISQKR